MGGFGLALLLMGTVSIASYRNTVTTIASARQVQHAYEVLNALTDFYGAMAVAESGRRGYVFLNDARELGRYQAAVVELQAALAKLHQNVKTDPLQQQQVQELTRLVRQRLALLKQSVELYQRDRTAVPEQITITEKSVVLRERIHQVLEAIELQDTQDLERSIAQSRASIHSRLWLELTGICLSFLVIVGVCVILYRQWEQREKVALLERTLAQEKELATLKLRLFSMISHEFRTPLSVILASSQLLEEILRELVEPNRLKNLHRIQASARLMNQLLTDILTLTRAETGNLEFKPESIDVEAFCLNLMEEIQFSSIVQPAIAFHAQGHCSRTQLDEKLLYSILSNLLLNAIKYSPDGGSITFTLTCESDVTLFQVADTGIGIPPEDQSCIYEPFYRGRNTAAIAGTGLGLAVVKTCLDLHGGEITCESAIGTGTTFTVRIPRQLDFARV